LSVVVQSRPKWCVAANAVMCKKRTFGEVVGGDRNVK
jgi:hypothetical protein